MLTKKRRNQKSPNQVQCEINEEVLKNINNLCSPLEAVSTTKANQRKNGTYATSRSPLDIHHCQCLGFAS